MLTLISNLPPFAVGVTAQGEITKKDFETVMIPALEKASKECPAINFMMVFETSVKNFTVGAWLQDVKVNVGFFLKWNKIAIVCNENFLQKISTISNVIIPGEVKNFELHQLQAAEEWISAP